MFLGVKGDNLPANPFWILSDDIAGAVTAKEPQCDENTTKSK
jgi:hypothetical protein